jgi:hypothetical protein
MGHIFVQRCPHVGNSDDGCVAMSAGTNSPGRVGIGGEVGETLRPSLGKCDGSRQAVREGGESEVVVDSGKWTVPRGNEFEYIGDSTSRGNSIIG